MKQKIFFILIVITLFLVLSCKDVSLAKAVEVENHWASDAINEFIDCNYIAEFSRRLYAR